MTKTADFDRYKYSGYGIGFDVRGSFLFSDDSVFSKKRNKIIFGIEMSLSVHIGNKNKKISWFLIKARDMV